MNKKMKIDLTNTTKVDWVTPDTDEYEWDDFRDNFNIGKTCLFFGNYFSRYPDFMPSCVAGRVIKIDSVDDFMKFTGGHPDQVSIWSDKDGLHVQNAHHDGTITLTVTTLTGKGVAYWNRMDREGNGQTLECHRVLDANKEYSSPIDYYIF